MHTPLGRVCLGLVRLLDVDNLPDLGFIKRRWWRRL